MRFREDLIGVPASGPIPTSMDMATGVDAWSKRAAVGPVAAARMRYLLRR